MRSQARSLESKTLTHLRNVWQVRFLNDNMQMDVNFATCAYTIKDRSKRATENALKHVKKGSSTLLRGDSVDAPPSPVLPSLLFRRGKDKEEEEEKEEDKAVGESIICGSCLRSDFKTLAGLKLHKTRYCPADDLKVSASALPSPATPTTSEKPKQNKGTDEGLDIVVMSDKCVGGGVAGGTEETAPPGSPEAGMLKRSKLFSTDLFDDTTASANSLPLPATPTTSKKIKSMRIDERDGGKDEELPLEFTCNNCERSFNSLQVCAPFPRAVTHLACRLCIPLILTFLCL